MLRFSGHDTFHCREQWLLKGIEYADNQEGSPIDKNIDAIVELGVGKNMVRAISHWLKSFNLVSSDNSTTYFADQLFSSNGFDKYLENEGSLWLLQFQLCNTNYASMYKLIFAEYFVNKATLDFTESQMLSFIERYIEEHSTHNFSSKTIASDFKVFLKTYITPSEKGKTIEDDINAPLQALNLILETNKRNSRNEKVYSIHRKNPVFSLTPEIFGFCLLEMYSEEFSVSLDQLRNTIAAYLGLSYEGLEIIIDDLCHSYTEFIFKSDAGIRQIQFRGDITKTKQTLLDLHYGI